MHLAALQGNFLAFLRDRPNAIAEVIAPGGRIGVAQRLNIYHHAYRARLLEVLKDVFERTWAYLGDEGFERCARRFIDMHAPSARTLQNFGADFPAWLGIEFSEDGDIADIAAIDWLVRRAFDGPDAEPISIRDLAGLTGADWANVSFDFHPTIQIAPIEYNAASMWEALEAGESPPPADRLQTPTWLLVWRKDLRPHFQTIGAIEVAAIEAMRTGATFAGTCEQLAATFPDEDVATLAGISLRRWVDDQLLTGVRINAASM